mmetsp:Transcript_3746/g.6389  ORF Transcript_3746/g.6389 Transcript_3746/m.6389 type:complete len:118 (+) Transcript_3746:576-929(+)
MAVDKWSQDPLYVKEVKDNQDLQQKEFDMEDTKLKLPEKLTPDRAKSLLDEKEKLLNSVYTQFLEKQRASDGQQFDLQQTMLLNKTMFDDMMYIKEGFTAKDLQRALVKYGIHEERL